MKKQRRFINQPQKMTISQIFGAIILFSGILVMSIPLLIDAFTKVSIDRSAIAAIGFLKIMLGLALFYPEMLEGPRQAISSMRVTVYMIISVFVFLTVKIGWTVGSFADFKLDETWAYILAIALGGKAIQSLGENNWLGKRTPPGDGPGPNAGINGANPGPGPDEDNDPGRPDAPLPPPQNLLKKDE